MAKYYIVVATGNTYPIKEDLSSWAFFWNAQRKVWIREGVDDDDKRLFSAFVSGIPGKNLKPKWPGVRLTFFEESDNTCDYKSV